MKDEQQPAEQLLTATQIANQMCVSLRTLWRLVAARKFPRPIRYSRKLVRWRESEVREALRKHG